MARRPMPPRDRRGRFTKRRPLPPEVVEQLGRDYVDLVVHERNCLETPPQRLVIDAQYLIPMKSG
jgi:hypothetical protein